MQTRMMEEVERTPVVSLKKNGMFNKVATIGRETMMLTMMMVMMTTTLIK